jgi:hypothetical protein
MRKRFIAIEAVIPSSFHRCGGCARSGERCKAEAGQNARGKRVPWVWDQENARSFMEGAEADCFFVLSAIHA